MALLSSPDNLVVSNLFTSTTGSTCMLTVAQGCHFACSLPIPFLALQSIWIVWPGFSWQISTAFYFSQF